jgi:hypothetical protein
MLGGVFALGNTSRTPGRIAVLDVVSTAFALF